jgi:hypothetical protein
LLAQMVASAADDKRGDQTGSDQLQPVRQFGQLHFELRGFTLAKPSRRRWGKLARAALGWLAIEVSAVPAIACDSGHWIDEVHGDGRIVILEDGSIWKVDDNDEVDTALWLPATDIMACADKLINTEDGEVAAAHRIR